MNAPFQPGRGFRDPVLGPQVVFRAVLQAMSRPGRPTTLQPQGVSGPSVAPATALAILLALCDYETPVWLDEEWRGSALRPWLAFHCGAPMAREPNEAAFGILRAASGPAGLARFAQCDARYPDRSTTLLALCDDFESGPRLSVEGPGVQSREMIAPAGLPEEFLRDATDNAALFPRGVDVLLVAHDRIIGLPRTSRLTLAGENA
ncbi:MAG: phosphonate C-P lyase system protein PhnH [Beijerinckiaceae bacterium]|jgi:alpha-D-ribose 1-methylphosphonate 5-triphosphate synthase subunit PhnH|nr:phosphonate C-P lyase system protein PhnH [Beijerinckiaceae bacterium]